MAAAKNLALENNNLIQNLLGDTDIYLIDQIMKGRYKANDKVLDAGCGNGRNLHWFLQNKIEIIGVDRDREAITRLKNKYPGLTADSFLVAEVNLLPFPDNCFDHILSSAVLHFARSTDHFLNMVAEMVRVLKPGGTLFVRMTSDIGIENTVELIGDGVYIIPDGSKRFLLSRNLLAELMQQNELSFIAPLKTVNVNDERCMSTLMLQKK